MKMFKRGDIWYIDYYDAGGIRHKESTKTSNKKLAEEILAKRKTESVRDKFGIQKIKKVLFKDFVPVFLEYCHTNKKKNTVDFYENSINNLSKEFDNLYLSGITPFLIEEYKSKRVKDVSNATVNRELATLNHLFNLAVKWEKADNNPVKDVKKLKEPDGRIRYLTQDEMAKLLNECNIPYLRLAVMIALNTGMRKGEIHSLKRADVNLEERLISINDSKSGKRRDIPINDALFPVLAQWLKDMKNNTLIPVADCRKAFENALERAGIENFTFHDLRHTFASYLVMEGTDLATVMELMGHATIQMTMRYAHLSPDHRKAAVNRLVDKYSIMIKNGSSQFTMGSLKEWRKLVERFRNRTPAVERIWNLLNKQSRDALEKWEVNITGGEKMKLQVVNGFNEVLKLAGLFNADDFQDVKIGKEAEKILEAGIDKLDKNELHRFNRLLFEAVFTDEITKSCGNADVKF